MLLALFAIVVGAAAGLHPSIVYEFEVFKQYHGKSYATLAEQADRLQTFAANKALIAALNQEHARDGVTFEMNQFGDMTPAEFQQRVLMPRRAAPAVP
jgi:hypothetical protein